MDDNNDAKPMSRHELFANGPRRRVNKPSLEADAAPVQAKLSSEEEHSVAKPLSAEELATGAIQRREEMDVVDACHLVSHTPNDQVVAHRILKSFSSREESGYGSEPPSNTNSAEPGVSLIEPIREAPTNSDSAPVPLQAAAAPSTAQDDEMENLCSDFRMAVQAVDLIPKRTNANKLLKVNIKWSAYLTDSEYEAFRQDEDGDTGLHIACYNSDEESLVAVIQHCVHHELLDMKNKYGLTALHAATLKNCPRFIRILVDAGSALDKQDNQGFTPLHWCCVKGYIDCAIELTKVIPPLKRCVRPGYPVVEQQIPQDLTRFDYTGKPCLHLAVQNGFKQIAAHLVTKAGCSPDVTEGCGGNTALIWVAEHNNLELVKFMVDTLKADVNKQNWAGYAPLRIAQGRKNTAMVEFLQSKGAEEVEVDSSYSDDSMTDDDDDDDSSCSSEEMYADLSFNKQNGIA